MDQTNSLAGLTHRRRLSALGAGGLTRERAPIEVRDVHPTHYGRMCAIETPEGPNIGLIGSLSSYAQVSEHGFVTTPYRVVKDGVVTNKIVHLDATQEEEQTIAQANAEIDAKTKRLKGPQVLCRSADGELVSVSPKQVDLMDVSPTQIWSVATALIPFLEHDDANRALMGSNMQRQAVPLLKPEVPVVGTGMEKLVARNSNMPVFAEKAGLVRFVDSTTILVDEDEYKLTKFRGMNERTTQNHRPVVTEGTQVEKGQLLADGASTQGGELTPEEKLLHAIFGKAGVDVKNASLTMPPGTRGVVIDAQKYSRRVNLTDVERSKALAVIRDAERDFLKSLRDYTSSMLREVKTALAVEVTDDLTGKPATIDDTATYDELRRVKLLCLKQAEEEKDKAKREKAVSVINDYTARIENKETEKNKIVNRLSRGDELPTGVLEKVMVY